MLYQYTNNPEADYDAWQDEQDRREAELDLEFNQQAQELTENKAKTLAILKHQMRDAPDETAEAIYRYVDTTWHLVSHSDRLSLVHSLLNEEFEISYGQIEPGL